MPAEPAPSAEPIPAPSEATPSSSEKPITEELKKVATENSKPYNRNKALGSLPKDIKAKMDLHSKSYDPNLGLADAFVLAAIDKNSTLVADGGHKKIAAEVVQAIRDSGLKPIDKNLPWDQLVKTYVRKTYGEDVVQKSKAEKFNTLTKEKGKAFKEGIKAAAEESRANFKTNTQQLKEELGYVKDKAGMTKNAIADKIKQSIGADPDNLPPTPDADGNDHEPAINKGQELGKKIRGLNLSPRAILKRLNQRPSQLDEDMHAVLKDIADNPTPQENPGSGNAATNKAQALAWEQSARDITAIGQDVLKNQADLVPPIPPTEEFTGTRVDSSGHDTRGPIEPEPPLSLAESVLVQAKTKLSPDSISESLQTIKEFVAQHPDQALELGALLEQAQQAIPPERRNTNDPEWTLYYSGVKNLSKWMAEGKPTMTPPAAEPQVAAQTVTSVETSTVTKPVAEQTPTDSSSIDVLAEPKKYASEGNMDRAAAAYRLSLIQYPEALPLVITDLQDLFSKNRANMNLRNALVDAYTKAGDVERAKNLIAGQFEPMTFENPTTPPVSTEEQEWLNSLRPEPIPLSPELYAEWADLLDENVDLDPEAAAILEQTLSQTAGEHLETGREASREQLELILEEDAFYASAPELPDDLPLPPPSEPLGMDSAVTRERIQQRLNNENINIDEAAEDYRDLLRLSVETAPLVLEDLRQLAIKYPNSPTLRRALGDAYMRNGRFQKAIEEYNRAVALNPTPAVA